MSVFEDGTLCRVVDLRGCALIVKHARVARWSGDKPVLYATGPPLSEPRDVEDPLGPKSQPLILIGSGDYDAHKINLSRGRQVERFLWIASDGTLATATVIPAQSTHRYSESNEQPRYHVMPKSVVFLDSAPRAHMLHRWSFANLPAPIFPVVRVPECAFRWRPEFSTPPQVFRAGVARDARPEYLEGNPFVGEPADLEQAIQLPDCVPTHARVIDQLFPFWDSPGGSGRVVRAFQLAYGLAPIKRWSNDKSEGIPDAAFTLFGDGKKIRRVLKWYVDALHFQGVFTLGFSLMAHLPDSANRLRAECKEYPTCCAVSYPVIDGFPTFPLGPKQVRQFHRLGHLLSDRALWEYILYFEEGHRSASLRDDGPLPPRRELQRRFVSHVARPEAVLA